MNHVVCINFENMGIKYPYHGNNKFNPNDPPEDYGQAIQISLCLDDYIITENIPKGAKPFFKVRRRKSGDDAIKTVGYKVGWAMSGGYFSYTFFDWITKKTSHYSGKT